MGEVVTDQPGAEAPVLEQDSEPQGIALPEPVRRRGISEAEWRMLFNLYPGARPESAVMVWDYCKVRGLDPMKKPCHIVPMRVKNARSGQWEWRDVVMPGIYEYRITAHRTGTYNGHSEPVYGEDLTFAGVTAPAWCALTAYRWNPVTAKDIPFPVKVHFREVIGTKSDGSANERWSRAPIQMLTKCAEAAALREAFPEEFGGESTAEERAGHEDDPNSVTAPEPAVRPPVRRSEKAAAPVTLSVMTIEDEAPPAAATVAPGANHVQPQATDNGPQIPATAKPVGSGTSDGATTREAATTAPGPAQTTKPVKITNTLVVDKRAQGGGLFYEIHGQQGVGKVTMDHVWHTPDEQLYRMAASCEGTDALFTITWHESKTRGQKAVKQITGLEAAS